MYIKVESAVELTSGCDDDLGKGGGPENLGEGRRPGGEQDLGESMDRGMSQYASSLDNGSGTGCGTGRESGTGPDSGVDGTRSSGIDGILTQIFM